MKGKTLTILDNLLQSVLKLSRLGKILFRVNE